MNRKNRILIVEDEEPIRRGLCDVFVYHGYEVESATTGTEGLANAKRGGYDLIILDVMLPGIDGFTICNELRSIDRDQPIIMLTAKSSDEDIIHGLTLGADDYIGKPFSVQQLVLRVEAVLRRSQRLRREQTVMQIGASLTVDSLTLSGVREGAPIAFTRREIEILEHLLKNSDRPVSRGELLEEVWGYRRTAELDTRTVDIHIAKLRRKIERDPKEPTLLVTVRGEGYQLLP